MPRKLFDPASDAEVSMSRIRIMIDAKCRTQSEIEKSNSFTIKAAFWVKKDRIFRERKPRLLHYQRRNLNQIQSRQIVAM